MVETIDREKFLEELIDKYSNLIFSICYNITKDYFQSEDLAQDTFLSAYRNMDSFKGGNEKAWICKIATNKCLDYVKRGARNTYPTEDEYFTNVQSEQMSIEDRCADNMVKERLYELCSSLKPPYDQVAVKYFCEEITVVEIAVIEDKPVKTIQTQVYRAKGMLKKLWRKEQLS